MKNLHPQKTRFYEIHVFYSRENGYSIPLKIKSNFELEEDQIIQYAVDSELFTEEGDELCVDYTKRIDENEYKLLSI